MTQAKTFEEKEDYEDEEDRPPRRPGEPRDGGWGWMIVLGAFVATLLIEGLVTSYPLLNKEIALSYDVDESSTKSVGPLLVGFYLISGPFAGVLTNKYGCKKVTIFGAVVTCVALLVSTHMPNVPTLTLVYGFCGGVGLGLVYLPSVVIICFWFEKRRAFATGIALCGSVVGTFIFPPLYKHLLDFHDWKSLTVIIAGVMLNCAVSGALYRPQKSCMKTKSMRRGIVQRGAIMKALIAEKERQRTISNGSLDNCIITRDNALIKIDKIDLRNKSSSYINRLKETFGFSSMSLNRSKNSLILPKVNVVEPIYRKPSPKPSPLPRTLRPKPASTPPTPKRDSGCGSLESPKAQSYNAIPTDDPSEQSTSGIPMNGHIGDGKKSFSAQNLNNNIESPKRGIDENSESSFLSVPVSPAGSGFSLDNQTLSGSLPNGKSVVIPVGNGSVMAVPSVHSVDSYYIESEKNCVLCRHVMTQFNLKLLKSPTFLILAVTSVLSMLGYSIPFLHLKVKATAMGLQDRDAKFLISILGAASLIGRFIAGWVCDRPWASAVHLNNVGLISAGFLSFFSPFYYNEPWLTGYAFFFGLFTAVFLSMRSIILIELLGKEKLANSFGLLTFFQGLALILGTLLAETLTESNSNIETGFYVVGACLLTAGIVGLPLKQIKHLEDKWSSRETLKIVSIEELPFTDSTAITLGNCDSQM